jgi:hypothetical protein
MGLFMIKDLILYYGKRRTIVIKFGLKNKHYHLELNDNVYCYLPIKMQLNIYILMAE